MGNIDNLNYVIVDLHDIRYSDQGSIHIALAEEYMNDA